MHTYRVYIIYMYIYNNIIEREREANISPYGRCIIGKDWFTNLPWSTILEAACSWRSNGGIGWHFFEYTQGISAIHVGTADMFQHLNIHHKQIKRKVGCCFKGFATPSIANNGSGGSVMHQKMFYIC